MPDHHGKVKGISTHGLKNAWLDSLDARKQAEREDAELERDSKAFEMLFGAPAHEGLKCPHGCPHHKDHA